ncbi:MAG: hypothetical protein EBR82_47290 [Caulobacteraceae bacterium]|nr:hypothetical protein [Caulobacteraceae bacterium]
MPVAFINKKYEVYVGDRMVRIFSEESLPDNIRALITMIKAGQKVPDDPTGMPTFTHAYDYPPDSNFYEIGWFVTKELFIVILPTKDLTNLKGDQYNELGLMEYRVYNRGNGRYVLAPTEPTLPFLEEFFWRRHLSQK